MKLYFILILYILYDSSVFGQISALYSSDGSILITPRGLKGKINNGASLGENALISIRQVLGILPLEDMPCILGI